jgi:putative ABC transport system permease protein
VRFRDLLGLALAALFRQKVRTLLTTLGVVFGTFVLAASLSVRGGVQETVVREARRFGELRRIRVQPRHVGVTDSVPAEVSEIRGQMSEARRQRLRAQAIRRWRGQQPSRPATKLNRKALDTLARIPSVRKVEPALENRCRVFFDGKAEEADCVAALPDDANYRPRVSVGTFLPAADAPCVVVSEDLLYRLGVADDAALAAVVGKKLRLKYGDTHQGHLLLLALQREPGQTTVVEEQTLEKVLAHLPEAVAQLKDLTPAERAAALKLLQGPLNDPAAKTAVVQQELTICGVFRLAAEQKGSWGWDQPRLNPDLIVPTRTAEAILVRLPYFREHGFSSATVEVERLEDVKPVTQTIIDRLGLNAGSRAEFVEREQFTYRLIFSAMTVIALVALLVAALGIMNTMLMGVLERVREIGIMKAVGARDGHIQLMFLIEGALVGLVGGLLGLLLSWAASFPLNAWTRSMVESGLKIKLQESIFLFPWWLLVGVPAFTCLVTTLAAYYPARRAARVNPVRALRHE